MCYVLVITYFFFLFRSPLFIALVFITFFHNVLSRHRIRHYKDRFKRQQGAHLYLPGSYVTEGGEGPDAGPWSDWSEPSPCSRTCGGGVSTQYRTCQEGYECQGPDKRHFSCNTQDCPDTSDFRAQQCSEFDDIPFETVKYQWVPYTKAPNPCELNCMPRGERFYYRHASKVIDGTRCNDENLDVCVNGKCQPVGCDMMLGSSAREDECRVCGGDGSTCNTIEHTIEMKDMQVGYNDILLIPAGATNILVEEVAPTNNYLAVRNTSGFYYLNGNWRVDFPRSMDFAGTKFHYDRYPQGFSAPDKLTALGPIDEPIFIVLLFQEASDVPVRYRYSLPTNVQPGSESETYAWTFDQFSPCSTTCGGGVQYRNVTCAGRKTLEPVERKLCDPNSEPEASRRCSEIPCEAQWVPHPWGNCSAPCGEEGGVQTREISCQQIVSNGYPSLVDESECAARPKPPQQQKCNQGKTCANWHTGPWKPCDHLCGPGKQTRQIKCYIKNDKGKIEILSDAECESISPKPAAEKKCNLRPCEGVDWITSEWSGCDRICGLTNETRKVFCATAEGQIHDDKLCEEDHEKPETVRNCDSTNATCEYLWYASQWSDCSAACGEGVQTRTLFCGVVTPEGVKKVENKKCDQSKNFETIKKCKGEEECEGEWFSGPWTECSKPCGGGDRTKKVVCIKGNDVVDPSFCDSSKVIFSQEDCNKQPCTADSIIPTDVTKSVDESEATTKPKEALTTTESAVSTTMATSEVSESSTIGASEETKGTDSSPSETDSSPSETELTDVFEVSTEPGETSSVSPDDEYEIVPADTCDDGEWVEVGVDEKEKDELQLSVTELAGTTESASGSSFSLEDLMLSDGTTLESGDTIITGSGDGETSPSGASTEPSVGLTESTDEEGSGSEASTIISDDYGTETVYRSSVSGETEAGTTPASSEITTEVSSTIPSSIGSTILPEISSSILSSTGSEASSISSGSTVSGLTEVSGSTESSASTIGISGSTEISGSTDISSSTDTSGLSSSTDISGSTDISSSTDSSSGSTDVTGTTESSISTESSSFSTESSISTETTETVSTEATMTSESSSISITSELSSSSEISTTDGSSTSEGSTTEGSSSSEGSTTEEISSAGTTEGDSTAISGSTESSTDSSLSSIATTTEEGLPGEAEETVFTTGAVTWTSSTFETESTSEYRASTTEMSGSTEESSAGNTEISDLSTESTTELSVSTESTTEGATLSTTEFTGSTETSTEFTSSTESTTEFTGSTEVSTPEVSGSTEVSSEIDIFGSTTESTEESSSEYTTTSITEIFMPKKVVRMCKRKKLKNCKKTQFGCCWDHITPAKGPFDKGCPTPKTCKESKYGCCEDGVSPALGPKLRGCPSTHCEETLFGCCEDGKTPAEGENDEGCPPPPPACLRSKYGCCKDNVTEAQGPKQKGCEPETIEGTTTEPMEEDCSNSTYGCCPDGVSVATGEYFEGCDIFKDNCTESYYGCCPDGKTSAKGPESRGCELSCASSTFGCCPDKVTPAHGQSGEGCCLAGPFGCCPDNITPARGINLEGCGCQYSPYGCCPDNKTSARGYDNAGCGCKYTEHGCCPDDYTRAHGPNYEGCLCHTFQFGCCPDGVSVAKGPHQQGCGCRNSEFGCCSDDETPASGPNMAGCGCEATKFGCCLDGVAEAQGENFEGCEEIPVNLQDSCSLPKERGTCKNYTVKWFYDMDYGGCSRFWYGGCEGNDNRYKSKEECDQICVEPQGEDRCKLPKVAGPCAGYYPQWYYDKSAKHCSQFVYGGCLGNNNRFETRDECMQLCVKDDSVDACEQPKEEGPCRGQNRRYFFDKASGQCQEFIYGGCKGNNNNYRSVEACNQKCATPGRKKDHCTLPRAQGNCTEKQPSWYYDTPEKRCLPFYYSGCNGNQNNFQTKEACETDCPPEIVKDTCHLPAETGECANYVDHWYFDTKEKMCRQFYYGGCGGNDNNFQTQEQCQNRCEKPREGVTQPESGERPEPTRSQPFVTVVTAVVPTLTQTCFYPPDSGPCRDNATARFYYDRSDGVCKSFTYGGCGGNTNNFNSLEECLQYCGGAQDVCTLPPVVGPCSGEYLQYYYDAATDSCKTFTFGGCEGNYNRFHDLSSCEQRCRKTLPTAPVATQGPPAYPSDVAMCYEPPSPGNCSESYSAYFFDQNSRVCTPFTYTGCGGNGNRFNTEEQCERQCGAFRGQDVCNLDHDTGPCRGYFPKYYYDRAAGRCGQFVYGGCQGNGNRFSSNEECERLCLTHDEVKPNITSTEICLLPADPGPCPEAYVRRWYFDNLRGECIAFIYSGCGGNLNNFKTFQSCLEYCKDLLPLTEQPPPPEPSDTPTHECQAVFDECTKMRCQYGVEAYIDENDCNRCQCHDPCKAVECPENQKCGIDLNFNKTSISDADFIAVCREHTKPGECPNLEQSLTNCDSECQSDADCTRNLKCCSTGCGTACVEPARPPAELVTQQPYLPAYTDGPLELSPPQPPKIDVQVYEPQVAAPIGDQVILNCAITGNPNPKITWSKGNILFDGTQPRFRIRLDQTLQIITLHKTDAGIYLCKAENNVGEPLTNQIKLDVLDSDPRPATIFEPEDHELLSNRIASLNSPITLTCFAIGYPIPGISWWKDNSMVPLKNKEFELRKDYSLLIHSVQLHSLGIYTCQTYNGVGKAASSAVTVRAKGPYYSTDPKDAKYLQYIVNPPGMPVTTVAPSEPPHWPYRPNLVNRPTPQPYIPPEIYSTEPSPEIDDNEIYPVPPAEGSVPEPVYTVPVKVNITTNEQKYSTGSDVQLPCHVMGFPLPQVQWYKDGIPVYPSERISITDVHTLIIRQSQKSDSGTYHCEATNQYSKASSSLAISIEGMYIHPSCTDNQFFANCALIIEGKYCTHKYYAKFCCRSCTEAGLLPVNGPHIQPQTSKENAIDNNIV